MAPAGAVNAHVQALTGPEWEMNGRASEVPATSSIVEAECPPGAERPRESEVTVVSDGGVPV